MAIDHARQNRVRSERTTEQESAGGEAEPWASPWQLHSRHPHSRRFPPQ